VLRSGARTADLGGGAQAPVGTRAMGDLVISELHS
jgi:hypothetical protein